MTSPINSSAPFADLRLRGDRRLARFAMLFLAAPSIWFVTVDFAHFADNAPVLAERLATRSILVGLPLGGFFRLGRVRERAAYLQCVWLVALGVALAYLVLNGLRPAGSGLPAMRTPLFAVAIMYIGLPNSRWRQIAPPLALTAGLTWLGLTRLRTPTADPTGDLLILAALNVAGLIFVHRRLRLEAELEAAMKRKQAAIADEASAAAELRMLRGIIPICTQCQGVRGQAGEWQLLEQYVHAHTDARFSHGVCPTCAQVHYSDFLGTKD